MERTRFNLKRRIACAIDAEERVRLAETVEYGGNPEHKRNPGDFGLTPPVDPRPDKTLCDKVEIFRRDEAQRLLRLGAKLGLVSERRVGAFPQNVWAVTESGVPLEAQLDNRETGRYHGYPIPETDPFREVVLEAWRRATP